MSGLLANIGGGSAAGTAGATGGAGSTLATAATGVTKIAGSGAMPGSTGLAGFGGGLLTGIRNMLSNYTSGIVPGKDFSSLPYVNPTGAQSTGSDLGTMLTQMLARRAGPAPDVTQLLSSWFTGRTGGTGGFTPSQTPPITFGGNSPGSSPGTRGRLGGLIGGILNPYGRG